MTASGQVWKERCSWCDAACTRLRYAQQRWATFGIMFFVSTTSSYTTKFRELRDKKNGTKLQLPARYAMFCGCLRLCPSVPSCSFSLSFFNCFCFNMSGILRMTEWTPWLKLLWFKPPPPPSPFTPQAPSRPLPTHHCAVSQSVASWEQKVRSSALQDTYCRLAGVA
jgi:hypothetical protein